MIPRGLQSIARTYHVAAVSILSSFHDRQIGEGSSFCLFVMMSRESGDSAAMSPPSALSPTAIRLLSVKRFNPRTRCVAIDGA